MSAVVVGRSFTPPADAAAGIAGARKEASERAGTDASGANAFGSVLEGLTGSSKASGDRALPGAGAPPNPGLGAGRAAGTEGSWVSGPALSAGGEPAILQALGAAEPFRARQAAAGAALAGADRIPGSADVVGQVLAPQPFGGGSSSGEVSQAPPLANLPIKLVGLQGNLDDPLSAGGAAAATETPTNLPASGQPAPTRAAAAPFAIPAFPSGQGDGAATVASASGSALAGTGAKPDRAETMSQKGQWRSAILPQKGASTPNSAQPSVSSSAGGPPVPTTVAAAGLAAPDAAASSGDAASHGPTVAAQAGVVPAGPPGRGTALPTVRNLIRSTPRNGEAAQRPTGSPSTPAAAPPFQGAKPETAAAPATKTSAWAAGSVRPSEAALREDAVPQTDIAAIASAQFSLPQAALLQVPSPQAPSPRAPGSQAALPQLTRLAERSPGIAYPLPGGGPPGAAPIGSVPPPAPAMQQPADPAAASAAASGRSAATVGARDAVETPADAAAASAAASGMSVLPIAFPDAAQPLPGSTPSAAALELQEPSAATAPPAAVAPSAGALPLAAQASAAFAMRLPSADAARLSARATNLATQPPTSASGADPTLRARHQPSGTLSLRAIAQDAGALGAPPAQEGPGLRLGEGGLAPGNLLSRSRDDAASRGASAGPLVQDLAPMPVTVTQQATHLPVVPASPFQQVIDAVVTETAAPADAPSGDGPTPAAPAAGQTMVRTLSITLEPGELGAVNVHMRLAAGRLDLNIEVARPQTLKSLTHDQAALATALKASGISVDAITIRAAGASGSTDHGGNIDAPQPFKPSAYAEGRSALQGDANSGSASGGSGGYPRGGSGNAPDQRSPTGGAAQEVVGASRGGDRFV